MAISVRNEALENILYWLFSKTKVSKSLPLKTCIVCEQKSLIHHLPIKLCTIGTIFKAVPNSHSRLVKVLADWRCSKLFSINILVASKGDESKVQANYFASIIGTVVFHSELKIRMLRKCAENNSSLFHCQIFIYFSRRQRCVCLWSTSEISQFQHCWTL